MTEFKINEFITLKLENGITKIHVGGLEVLTCSFLLLDIPCDNIESVHDIDSIDEAAEKLDRPPIGYGKSKKLISAETEFWGHCSNLQVWVEHNYDTRLLHSNLSFPLLKKLTDAGDPIAQKYFKEEIAKRYTSNYEPVKEYIHQCGYLSYLNKEELASIGVSEALIKNIVRQNELTYLTPVHLSELGNDYSEIIERILENRSYHTYEFYRIARVTKFPSILVADFSTIPGKYPSLQSEIYLRFIIAPNESAGNLSSNHIKSIRFETSLRYNLEVNAIPSSEFFVTLLDLLFFHLMDLWS